MSAAMPARKSAAARTRATTSRVAQGGHLIPVAVGRTAGAVRQIPDSTLLHGLTRGRVWIAVLGILLIGIVALNVATLSFSSSSGRMERQALSLEQQNSALRAGLARQLSNDRVEAAALSLGLARPGTDEYIYRIAGGSAGAAADRLAAASAVAE